MDEMREGMGHSDGPLESRTCGVLNNYKLCQN